MKTAAAQRRGAADARGPRAEQLEARVLFAASDLDPTFAGDGTTMFAGLGPSAVLRLDAQADGKTLLFTDHLGNIDPARVTRLNPDGSIDTTFGGGDGVFDLAVAGTFVQGYAAAGGAVYAAGSAGGRALTLAKFTADGALDPSFGGGDGVATTAEFPPFQDPQANNNTHHHNSVAIAAAPDGRVVVFAVTSASTGSNYTVYRLSVARFMPDGAPDPTFGQGGIVAMPDRVGQTPGAMAVANDGGVVITTSHHPWSFGRALLLRLRPDGAPDPAFGDNGAAGVRVPGPWLDQPIRTNAVAVTASGEVLVRGVTRPKAGANEGAYVAKFRPDGRLDTSFGGGPRLGGVPGFSFPEPQRSVGYYDGPMVLAGGRIYLAATAFPRMVDDMSNAGLTVMRLTANGAPDRSFGTGGVARVDFPLDPPRGMDEHPRQTAHVAVAPSGQVVVAGDTVRGVAAARLVGTPEDAPQRTIDFGDGRRATFTDASGDRVTISLTGPGSGQVFLAQNPGDATWVTLTGTTGASSLAVRGNTSVRDVTVGGALKSFNGRGVDLAGEFTAASSVGRVQVRSLSDAVVSAPSFGAVSVAGAISRSSVHAADGIGTLQAGSLVDSRVGVGLGPAAAALPHSLGEFANPAARLGKLQVRSKVQWAFGGSTVAAPVIGQLVLGRVAPSVGTFGVAADSVALLRATTPDGGRLIRARLDDPADAFAMADFVVRLL